MAPASERRRRARRRDRTAQLTVLAAALVAGLIAAVAASPRTVSAASTVVATTPTTVARQRPANTFLFGHIGTDGRADLLVLFGWPGGARSGTALLIPATTLVEVPSFGPQALADVPRLASQSLLRVVVENALAVRVNRARFVTNAQLAALLAPARTLRVDFPDATRVDDSFGTVAFHSGTQRIAAADAARVLGGKGASTLSHLVAVGAVLDGWRAALADRAIANATRAVDRRVAPLVNTATAHVQDDTLPVAPLSAAGEERFQPREPDATDTITQAFGWARFTHGTRPRVQILNGVGRVGLTQAVAAKIVPAGGEVALTDNLAGFGKTRTQVVYYRENGAAAARRFAKVLGATDVERAADTTDVVDITIVVGADVADRL